MVMKDDNDDDDCDGDDGGEVGEGDDHHLEYNKDGGSEEWQTSPRKG